MMRYLSFFGVSFIFLIAFGLVNYYHLQLEKTRPGSFMERITFLLILPLGLFALPAIILSYPAKKLSDRQIEEIVKQDERKRYESLIAIPNRLLKEAHAKLERYDRLITEDRKRCREEGFQEGFSAASVQYKREQEFRNLLEYKRGYIDGHSDHAQGINRLEEFEDS